jgi:hypothetical protein
MPTRSGRASRGRPYTKRGKAPKGNTVKKTTNLHPSGTLAALAAEGRARIAQDQAEFDLEDGIIAPQPPEEELKRLAQARPPTIWSRIRYWVAYAFKQARLRVYTAKDRQ